MFILHLIAAFLAGALLGVIFFGGLWWTVQRITGSGRPYLVSAVSFALRSIAVLGGFYILLGFGLPVIIAAMVGFLAARVVLLSKLKPH